jgi:hypothetical protein
LSIRSFVDVIGDVVIFVNAPVETVNHAFVEELTAQALRRDCGVVTGLALTAEGSILHSGLMQGRGRELVDAFAGLSYPQSEHNQQINVARQVDAISDYFFATRREHLLSVGGLTAISGGYMQRLAMRLVENAKSVGLKVIITPFAVACFHPPSGGQIEADPWADKSYEGETAAIRDPGARMKGSEHTSVAILHPSDSELERRT